MKEQKSFPCTYGILRTNVFHLWFALGINSLLVPVLKVSLSVSSMERICLLVQHSFLSSSLAILREY